MQLSHSIQMMGTTIDILIDSDTPKEHISEVCRLLTLYKNRFSANDADSELMVINDNSSIAPVTVHPDLFDLIAIGKKHSLATPSNLNIAIGPLVQSWRIGFDDARVPSPQKIQKALALSKPENIILNATKQSVFLSQKGMKIDLGALAKGYIADKIMDYLKSEKVTSAMINLGGNVLVYREYKQILQNIEDAEEMIKDAGGDPELEEMAKEELKDSKAAKEDYEEKLKILLLPKDPNDDKNIILEIRGAAGGDEAALFAGDLLQMYQKYAESQGWKFDVMEASYNGVGGIKEVIVMVSGQSVYSKLKYESGAHRVQRVPVTESQGRVHTSTATVLVMPEVEEVEYEIDPKDLRVDIYHASGAGGQNVNKVATAVRMVHIPTGIKVEMQEERTQQKNRDKAMKIIRARVADHFAQIAQDEQDAERKSTVGTGDRSERIRTYNFPQNRVTDHRIGLTLQKLDSILSGKLDEVIDALILFDQTKKLEELNK